MCIALVLIKIHGYMEKRRKIHEISFYCRVILRLPYAILYHTWYALPSKSEAVDTIPAQQQIEHTIVSCNDFYFHRHNLSVSQFAETSTCINQHGLKSAREARSGKLKLQSLQIGGICMLRLSSWHNQSRTARYRLHTDQFAHNPTVNGGLFTFGLKTVQKCMN